MHREESRGQVMLRKPEIVEVVELGREEEPLHVERRVVDNSENAAGDITRTLEISDYAAMSVTTSTEDARALQGGGRVTIAVADIAGKMEQALREKYQLVNERRLERKETLIVNVPANKKVIVEIHWKLIWANGSVRMRDARTKVIVDLPFRFSLKLSFDTKTRNLD